MIVDVHAAQTDLAKLIEQAEAGEEVIIARNSEPVVRLVPIGRPRPKRVFGALKGKISLTPEFFEPLPDDEREAWGR